MQTALLPAYQPHCPAARHTGVDTRPERYMDRANHRDWTKPVGLRSRAADLGADLLDRRANSLKGRPRTHPLPSATRRPARLAAPISSPASPPAGPQMRRPPGMNAFHPLLRRVLLPSSWALSTVQTTYLTGRLNMLCHVIAHTPPPSPLCESWSEMYSLYVHT